jgi:two-component system, NtrC family, nitrogen regulation response regulator GlnG
VADDTTLMPAPGGAKDTRAVLALTILYHPDVSRVGERAYLEGGAVELSRAMPLFGERNVRPLDDRYISRKPLVITRERDGVSLDATEGARIVVDGQPLAGSRKLSSSAVEAGVVIELGERAVLLLHMTGARPTRPAHGLVGDSEALGRVRDDITKVADLDVPVLLRGETGTGKELVAQAIHAASAGNNPKKPFVAVNVAALPPATAASELFGHVRGAFTGATHDQEGLFVRADGGTLFLDEIGETPFDVQPMLLRALETNEVTPLGGGKVRHVHVRLLAATDADLEMQVTESGFRSALFHRLAGYQILLPPLRERRDDIGRLLVYFLRKELDATGDLSRLEGQRDAARLWLPAAIVARLARHSWPGNVRQLRNAVRQLAISNRGSDGARIDPALERLLAATPPSTLHSAAPIDTKRVRRDMGDISDDELLAALRANGWRAGDAAAQLGVSRSSLYNLIDRSKRIRKVKDISETELRDVFDRFGGEVDAIAAELEVSRKAVKLRLAQLGWA